MTITKRLALLIVGSLIALLLVGGVALYQMRNINGSLLVANKNTIPSIQKIADIDATFFRLRIHALNYALANDAQRASLEADISHRKGELAKLLADYEPLVSDEKDKGYLEQTKSLLGEYYGILDGVLQAARSGQPEKAKAGLAEGAITAAKISENIAAHSKYNGVLGDNEVKKAADAYGNGLWTMVLVIVAGSVGTVIMGVLIQRHVGGALDRMVTTFAKIESSLDFTSRLKVQGSDEVALASNAFDRLLDKLQQSLREILTHTDQVNNAANRVATASQQMSIASSHQSEAASSMAATVEEMTVSINHVADRANEANQLANSSGQQARTGETIIGTTVSGINSIAETVNQAAQQISALEQQSERINHVVAVIKEVADQTNLLALNAAIEAARAGEQGRGFAVVADEVRKLAERTTQSTQEIGATIVAMQSGAQSAVSGIQQVVERVKVGVDSAEQANGAIQTIGQSSRDTVAMVADITDAIREQSIASNSIAQQVEQIAQMSEENSSASHSTADAAGELAGLASRMKQIVAQYRV